MNIQALMKEAQKMQKDLQKTQEDLGNTLYEGNSSAVKVVLNGAMEMKSISIDRDYELDSDGLEMLEDMILVAYNDALKKITDDKNKKLSKYGNSLNGLM